MLFPCVKIAGGGEMQPVPVVTLRVSGAVEHMVQSVVEDHMGRPEMRFAFFGFGGKRRGGAFSSPRSEDLLRLHGRREFRSGDPPVHGE